MLEQDTPGNTAMRQCERSHVVALQVVNPNQRPSREILEGR